MNGWQSAAIAVCTTAVLCTVFSRLFSDTGVGRQGKFLLPCVFLCATLTAVVGNSFSLPDWTASVSLPDTEAVETAVYRQTAQQVNETLLQMVNQALSTYQTQAKKVVADMDISQEEGINMGQITVYVAKEEIRHAVLIKQVAEKRLGTDVVVALWEETG